MSGADRPDVADQRIDRGPVVALKVREEKPVVPVDAVVEQKHAVRRDREKAEQHETGSDPATWWERSDRWRNVDRWLKLHHHFGARGMLPVRALTAAACASLLALSVTTHVAGSKGSEGPALHSTPAAALSPAWLTYHLDNARSGNDTSEPSTASVASAWTAHTATGSTTLDGQLYATPLVYGTSVYVVTENNTVYAFSTANGNEQWHVHLGVPRNASCASCQSRHARRRAGRDRRFPRCRRHGDAGARRGPRR